MCFLLGRKGSPEQNHGDVTTRTRIRTRVAKPTVVHYSQNAGWTVRKIKFSPLSSHYTRMWYLSYCFLMWNHKASSRQTAAPLVSAVTSLTFSTSPQRLMDHFEGSQTLPLTFLPQCLFSVASINFTHRHSTPKEWFNHQGRRFLKNKVQTQ